MLRTSCYMECHSSFAYLALNVIIAYRERSEDITSSSFGRDKNRHTITMLLCGSCGMVGIKHKA